MPRLPAALSVTAMTIATSPFLPLVMNCLTPFEHVVVAVARRRRLQAVGLRADVRLGQAERAEHLAARERPQPPLLLRLVRPRHQDRADRAVVDADDGRRGAVAGGDLLEDDGEREVVEAGAVALGRHGDAVAAERGEALQLGLREVAVAVPLAPRSARSGRARSREPRPGRRRGRRSRIIARGLLRVGARSSSVPVPLEQQRRSPSARRLRGA